MLKNSVKEEETLTVDILKVCCGSWENASRDKRELALCREMGYSVAVLSKGGNEDKGRLTDTEGFSNFLYTTAPIKWIKNKMVNRFVSFILWAKFVEKMNPRIVSGHDISGVLIGIVARVFGYRGKIIYDSHEFELGRHSRGLKIPTCLIKMLERISIRNSEFTIVVNESIKTELLQIYKPKNPVIVVRSTPEKWRISNSDIEKQRDSLLSLFENKNSIKYLLMFHGLLGQGNGIEHIVEMLPYMPEVGLIMMGNIPSMEYYTQINDLAQRLSVSKRVLRIPAVPYGDIVNNVGAVDFDLMLIEGTSKSYYYVLPNKLFESIQSLTPIIVSDLPEMRRIVEQYGVGMIVDDFDALKNAKALLEILQGKEKYKKLKENLLLAKDELCWENEKVILKNAYQEVLF